MLTDSHIRRRRCAEQARAWLSQRPVVLDTETTGLGGADEMVQVAVVDTDGNVLLDTLVQPTCPIHPQASMIHGITEDDVAGAPTGAVVCRQLWGMLGGRLVCAYNATFDTRLLAQSARAWGVSLPQFRAECVMKLFAQFEGEWNSRHQGYRWHKLSAAAAHLGLDGHEAHDALSDALITARILNHIAAWGRGFEGSLGVR